MPESKGDDLSGNDMSGAELSRLRSEAARLLGRSRSARKAVSSRENGKKGGRPQGFVPSVESRQKQSETMKRYHQQKRNEQQKPNEQGNVSQSGKQDGP